MTPRTLNFLMRLTPRAVKRHVAQKAASATIDHMMALVATRTPVRKKDVVAEVLAEMKL